MKTEGSSRKDCDQSFSNKTVFNKNLKSLQKYVNQEDINYQIKQDQKNMVKP